jgi:hypothetical protein
LESESDTEQLFSGIGLTKLRSFYNLTRSSVPKSTCKKPNEISSASYWKKGCDCHCEIETLKRDDQNALKKSQPPVFITNGKILAVSRFERVVVLDYLYGSISREAICG